MSNATGDGFGDEVPVADAVEQSRPAAEHAELESVDPGERVPVEDGETPLEADRSDWQEQHQQVDDPDEDDVR